MCRHCRGDATESRREVAVEEPRASRHDWRWCGCAGHPVRTCAEVVGGKKEEHMEIWIHLPYCVMKALLGGTAPHPVVVRVFAPRLLAARRRRRVWGIEQRGVEARLGAQLLSLSRRPFFLPPQPFAYSSVIPARFSRALTRGSLSELPGGRPMQCVTPLTSTTHCRSPTLWCATGGSEGGGDGQSLNKMLSGGRGL